ncbi:CLUMA_CG002869, isoform A [Clunio marinus]|uniref:CLUMA_CG002869, isoform A n=1 Tax=Clunio marinus TaxID=568069 RepID=A0A1J1HMB2_9DIPT|nr:CLUMA_CG002869, isoform A [Clunio marinus]
MVSQQSKDFLPIKVASCQKYVHCASDIQQEKSKEKVKKVGELSFLKVCTDKISKPSVYVNSLKIVI